MRTAGMDPISKQLAIATSIRPRMMRWVLTLDQSCGRNQWCRLRSMEIRRAVAVQRSLGGSRAGDGSCPCQPLREESCRAR